MARQGKAAMPARHNSPGGAREGGGRKGTARKGGARNGAGHPGAAPRDPCTCFALRRAARVVTQLYDRALAPTGLSIGQYSLLAVLGAADAPVPLTQLARRADMERSTLTRSLAPLQRDGLVTVAAAAAGRGSVVALTPSGRARLAAARAPWHAAQGAVREAVGAAELGKTLAALDRLRDAVRVG